MTTLLPTTINTWVFWPEKETNSIHSGTSAGELTDPSTPETSPPVERKSVTTSESAKDPKTSCTTLLLATGTPSIWTNLVTLTRTNSKWPSVVSPLPTPLQSLMDSTPTRMAPLPEMKSTLTTDTQLPLQIHGDTKFLMANGLL